MSSAPHLNSLAQAFGNATKEFLFASNVVLALTEKALQEAAETDKVLNMSKELAAEKDKILSLNFTCAETARDLMDASTEILRL